MTLQILFRNTYANVLQLLEGYCVANPVLSYIHQVSVVKPMSYLPSDIKETTPHRV